MGKKYIVEIGRLERLYKASADAYGKPNITWLSPKTDLTLYTEPDLEQVRKEAYEEGRKVGIKDGMCEAWEVARKVTQVRKYGGYGDCLEEVFGRHRVPWDVFDYSATEAIEKIRQYEQRQEEQDGLRQNIQTIVDKCGYSLDEIAAVLEKMREESNG